MELVRRLALEGLLTDEELAAVVARRAAFGEPAPVALVALRLASADAIMTQLDQMGFDRTSALEPGPAARTLPRGMLRALWVLPLADGPRGPVVAMVDPTDRHARRELEFHMRRPIEARVAPMDALREVLLQVDPPRTNVHRSNAPRRDDHFRGGLGALDSKSDTTVSKTHGPPKNREPVDESEGKPTSYRVPEEALSFATRAPVRRATPAYGQASQRPDDAPPRAAGFTKSIPKARPLEQAALALGAWEPVTKELPSRDTQRSAPGANRRGSSTSVRVPQVAPVPREALYALAELSTATDRDTIARAAARGMTTEAERAAFFVLKKNVVQGWEGAAPDGPGSAGMSREALRNLWIPVTAPSVFRLVHESRKSYLGALSDSTADSILAAAMGGRPDRVLLSPIEVRRHVVAFLYADALRDPEEARRRMGELVDAASEAFARWLALRAAGR